MAEVIVITGGDIGDVAKTLRKARSLIEALAGRVVAKSSVLESAPWGFESDTKFMNQVLVVETELEPDDFLAVTQHIERELGRTEKTTTIIGEQPEYRSRPIDIDVLFYDDRVIETPWLSVPHPMIEQREFVLHPLCEVAGAKVHPVTKKSMWQIYSEFKTGENNEVN